MPETFKAKLRRKLGLSGSGASLASSAQGEKPPTRQLDPSASHSMSELLPWMYPTDEACDKIVCKDDSILAAWSLRGVDIESGDPSILEQAALQMDSTLRRVAPLGTMVWVTLDRRPAGTYPYSRIDNPVATDIDHLWGETFESHPLYENHVHLAAAMPTRGGALSVGEAVGQQLSAGQNLPKAVAGGVRSRVHKSSASTFQTRDDLTRMAGRFENAVANALDVSMTELRVRRLKDRELLGYLKSTASANPMAPVGYPVGEYLDTYLSDTFITNTCQDYLVLDGAKRLYAGVFTLKSAPGPDLLQGLNPLMAMPVHLRIGVAWKSASQSQADRFLAGARAFDEMRSMSPRRLMSMVAQHSEGGSDGKPTTKVGAAAEELREANKRHQASFGWMATSVTVFAESPEALVDAMDLVQRALERTGFVFIRERDGSLSGFCTGIPGHLREVVRWHFVEASNFTDMVPMITLDPGEVYHPFFSEGQPELVPPNAVLRTRYNTVQYFNYHVGQGGHTLIVGPTRNGKTMFQMFLTSQFLKYKNARVFILDKDLSCKPPTLLLDGRHIDLDPNRGGGLKLNPLTMAANDAGITWLTGWIDRLLQARGEPLGDKDMQDLYEAIERVMALKDPGVRLTSLLVQLPVHLRERLKPWCEGGPYGMYFDHVEDDFEFGRVTCAEVGSLINAGLIDVVRGFTDYAFYRIERFLNDTAPADIGPTMVYFEEAGFLLDSPIFAARAKDYLMTLAKKNAFLVMTAQSPEPFINQPDLGAAVRDNIATILFLPNHNASRAELARKYRDVFGLNDVQLDLIAGAAPKREYCIYQPQVDLFRVAVAQFPPGVVARLRSDKKSLAVFHRYYDPGDPTWKDKYLKAVLDA